MNKLMETYGDEIQKILAKYPEDQKRSAVMPLLYLAQREEMYVTQQGMKDIAEILGISTTEVATIIGFYTLYYDEKQGTSRVQVCTDLPCALRGADKFMTALCEQLGLDPHKGGTTEDGKVTVEPVMCLAACDKAPMFQLQNGQGLTYHENQSVETALALIEELRKK